MKKTDELLQQARDQGYLLIVSDYSSERRPPYLSFGKYKHIYGEWGCCCNIGYKPFVTVLQYDKMAIVEIDLIFVCPIKQRSKFQSIINMIGGYSYESLPIDRAIERAKQVAASWQSFQQEAGR